MIDIKQTGAGSPLRITKIFENIPFFPKKGLEFPVLRDILSTTGDIKTGRTKEKTKMITRLNDTRFYEEMENSGYGY